MARTHGAAGLVTRVQISQTPLSPPRRSSVSAWNNFCDLILRDTRAPQKAGTPSGVTEPLCFTISLIGLSHKCNSSLVAERLQTAYKFLLNALPCTIMQIGVKENMKIAHKAHSVSGTYGIQLRHSTYMYQALILVLSRQLWGKTGLSLIVVRFQQQKQTNYT